MSFFITNVNRVDDVINEIRNICKIVYIKFVRNFQMSKDNHAVLKVDRSTTEYFTLKLILTKTIIEMYRLIVLMKYFFKENTLSELYRMV